MKRLLIGLLCVLIIGCKVDICETDSDCNESEFCYCENSMFNPCYCREPLYFWEFNTTDFNFSNQAEDNSTFNFTFNLTLDFLPENEIIPDDYENITIYEEICVCNGNTWCNLSWPLQCTCDKYCYNKSKEIWIEKR